MKSISNQKSTKTFVLAALFVALIIVMTIVPYTGYINYAGLIEITTLHIVVIIGSIFLGWKYGLLLGAVWGLTCLARAFTNPAWIMFTNPLISVLPRILVGLVAGLLFMWLKKTKLPQTAAVMITTVGATLTNTVLVLSAMYIFGGMIESYAKFFEMFKTIFTTLIGVNGIIELVAAVILVPILYRVLQKVQ